MRNINKIVIIFSITIGLTIGSNLFLDLLIINNSISHSTTQNEKVENLHISDNNENNIIVFFNKSTY
ncbi:MAG: hypothetical protein ACFE8G_06190, partial [Candidatus Hermodarchaeota archaeon]